MKMLVTSAAAQSFSATPTLSGTVASTPSADPLSSVSAPSSFIPDATQTVHVGTDTSTGQTVYYYNSASITITAGDTVTWQLDGTEDHTVTSDLATNDPQYFDSGSMLSDGGTFSHTFLAPGVYHYHCVIHDFQLGNGQWAGQQLGTVTVLAAPEPASVALLAVFAGGLLWRRRRA